MKRWISRFILFSATMFFPLKREKIALPENYRIFFEGNIPLKIKDALIDCYIEIFSEAPWYEKWSRESVSLKIEKDLRQKDSFLVVYLLGEEVAGFSWGAIIDKKDIVTRATDAIGTSKCSLFLDKKERRVLYCDEFAIAAKGRRGIDPVRFILRKFLEYAHNKGVKETIFWSTPASKIVPLAKTMGYEECGKADINGKRIVFLVNKNFISLLKITRNIKADSVNSMIALQKKRRNKKAGI